MKAGISDNPAHMLIDIWLYSYINSVMQKNFKNPNGPREEAAAGWGLGQGGGGETCYREAPQLLHFMGKQRQLGTLWKTTLLPVKTPADGRGE